MKHILALLLTIIVFCSCSGGVDQEVILRPVGNEMKYEMTEFKVKAGSTVKVIIKNTATLEIMKHNVVILKSNKNVTQIGQQALTAPNHIPTHPDILAYTELAGPMEQKEVIFTAPKPGRYPYICTFPGHYMMMKGVMISEED